MSYLLITNTYPNKHKIYANAFIHRRVKAYKENGLDVKVVVFTTAVKEDEIYDGVHIMYMDEAQLFNHLTYNTYTKLLFHFINYKMFAAVEHLETKPDIVVWLHGFEAETWYTRYYNFLSSKKNLDAVLQKKDDYFDKQRKFLRHLMTRNDINVQFIYVSNAFKTLYVDPNVGVSPKNYNIIPNIVDAEMFPYKQKDAESRFNIISIRPFTAKNYANDITVEVIKQLKSKAYFNKLTFDLYGDGPLFDSITKPIKHFKNVTCHKQFVPQDEITYLHERAGIYLGPTRHDSQGVSLNEAMSSGLVTVSNDIGGVSEFIEHKRTGLLAQRDNVEQMVEYIDILIKNPDIFLLLSENASVDIQLKTGKQVVIKRELEVILDD
ncbi:glycosyltransferase family 4 protein [Mammaliicoccus stepanovicii]|uniref:Glycosyl transferase, group 1 family protein n=1 Tax=Mammaliicoccus stepanovicii TaxID=643214 RepID=A0A239ZPT2_9STAP|nr:glycosyltransferase family 4 protein [Mammaliicoccus stepanovicii]PNZ76935.1 hypothetical protein CD111_05495 [Mammaliicoccus stepanovicii]GGI41337.1 hypothetical protein GCM10010896_12850 [Mammaliicoccus stepanovicii]SNV73341.1 glycosyl transferase, group 1 family protein [Mammaliicoccus stepanovicii]